MILRFFNKSLCVEGHYVGRDTSIRWLRHINTLVVKGQGVDRSALHRRSWNIRLSATGEFSLMIEKMNQWSSLE